MTNKKFSILNPPQVPLFRPLVHLVGLEYCYVEINIPLKYFKSHLDIIEAEVKFLEMLSSEMSKSPSAYEEVLDFNALQRDSISPVITFEDMSHCRFAIHVIPGNSSFVVIKQLDRSES